MQKHFAIGIAVAAVCLYFAFRGISFIDLAHSLRMAHVSWIILAMAVYSVGYYLRALRWEVLMSPIKKITAHELLGPLLIGFFANNILPFRIGELVRAQVAGKKFQISRTASLGTILLERISDTISFLLTFMAAAIFFPF